MNSLERKDKDQEAPSSFSQELFLFKCYFDFKKSLDMLDITWASYSGALSMHPAPQTIPSHFVSLKQNDQKAFVFFEENFTFSSIDLDVNVVSFMIWDRGKDLVCPKQEWQKDQAY